MKKDATLEQLVIEEATNLKQYATAAELDRLNLKLMSGDSKSHCIYGQMTGSCTSERAAYLIKLCATRVYNATEYNTFDGELNGAPKKVEPHNRLNHYVSPIEMLVFRYKPFFSKTSTKVNKLVAFLTL